MSSIGFETTFEHAAALVRAQCGDLPGLETVLGDLRKRVQTDALDPLENRDLIVEPHIDAQMLDVPQKTVECVAAELHRLHLLHIWARITCPWEEGETVVETDDPKVFQTAIQNECPHCGQSHEDLLWDNIETFYAFHFDSHPDKFKFRDFFRPPRLLPGPRIATKPDWSFGKLCRSLVGGISRFFREGPRRLYTRSLRP
jgi:hypothetical protein